MENLVAIKEGCLTTFKMVYFQYHAKLYAYLVSKSSSSYIAEEVVQLTFIKLWNSRLNISEQFPIDVQLFRIARTILIDELRKDAVRNNYINQLEQTITADNSDRIADRDTLTQVNKAIELLYLRSRASFAVLPPARQVYLSLYLGRWLGG